MPSTVLQKLKADCFRISALSLANTNEMLRLLEIYKQQGILAVPYKGAYLANQYYGDFGLREFSDIDLFVNEEDIDRIKEVMVEEGYKSPYNMSEKQEKWNRKIDCDYNFDKKDEQGNRLFHVETHYRTTSRCYSIDMRLESITKNMLMGKSINTLTNEDHLIFVLTHHGIKESWSILKYIFDIKQILDKGDFDWDKVIHKTDKYYITPALKVGISMIETLFSTTAFDKKIAIDDKTKLLANSMLYKLNHYEGYTSNLNRHWRGLVYRFSFDKRPHMVINHLTPLILPSKTDFDFLKSPHLPIPFFYFIRPMRMITEFFKNLILKMN